MKNMFNVFFLCFLLLVGLITVPASTLAEQIDKSSDFENLSVERQIVENRRNQEIERYFGRLNDLKAKLHSVKLELLDVNISKNEKDNAEESISYLQERIAYLESNLHLVGLERIEPSDNEKIDILSSKTDVSYNLSLYRDLWSGNSNVYVASADWTWDVNSWSQDKTGTGNVGGKDGITLGFNQKINKLGDSFNIYWSYTGTNATSTTSANETRLDNGYGWDWQDKIYNRTIQSGITVRDYNSGYGTVTLRVEFPNKPNSVELYTNFGHTWNTTSVTGFTLSWPPSVTFSSSLNRWADSESKVFNLN